MDTTRNLRSVIDHINIRQRSLLKMQDGRVCREIYYIIDHHLQKIIIFFPFKCKTIDLSQDVECHISDNLEKSKPTPK